MRVLKLIWTFLLLSHFAWAQPVDNPYWSKYPNAPSTHWTNFIQWGRVVNINQVAGSSWLDKLNRAQDSLSLLGGGIIYFPAGTYYFEEDILLKTGIIIRGDYPANNDAKSPDFAPPTRWVFPQYIPSFSGSGTPNSTSFKVIRADIGAGNIGLVHLDINRGRISLSTGYSSTSFGTLVFGIRQNNIAVPSTDVPSANQFGWQRFCSRFASNILVRNNGNAIVANCRLNDFTNNTQYPIPNEEYEQPNYLADSSNQVVIAPQQYAKFSYTDHYGIHFQRANSITYGTPQTAPELFKIGGEILDNWVFKTMRVGIHAAGLGLIIKGNSVTDLPNKVQWLNPQGTGWIRNMSATLENRGIDFSGWNISVDSNYIRVNRHTFFGTSYQSIDGEGILVQECCGGTSVKDYKIRGNNLNAYIGIYKMRDIHNLLIDGNNLNGESNILVSADRNGCSLNNQNPCATLRNIFVTNNFGIGGWCGRGAGTGIAFEGALGGQNVFCYDNSALPYPDNRCNNLTDTFSISRPCYVSLNPNPQNPDFNQNTLLRARVCSPTFVSSPFFPDVRLISPTDTTIIQAWSGTNSYMMQADAVYNPNNLCRIEWWVNQNLVDTSNSANPNWLFYNWPINPQMDGIYQVSAKIIDLNTPRQEYGWSQTVQVLVKGQLLGLKKDKSRALVNFYPNPANEFIVLNPEGNWTGNLLTVKSLEGKSLINLLLTESNQRLATEALAPGIYLLELKTKNGPIVEKLVVSR